MSALSATNQTSQKTGFFSRMKRTKGSEETRKTTSSDQQSKANIKSVVINQELLFNKEKGDEFAIGIAELSTSTDLAFLAENDNGGINLCLNNPTRNFDLTDSDKSKFSEKNKKFTYTSPDKKIKIKVNLEKNEVTISDHGKKGDLRLSIPDSREQASLPVEPRPPIETSEAVLIETPEIKLDKTAKITTGSVATAMLNNDDTDKGFLTKVKSSGKHFVIYRSNQEKHTIPLNQDNFNLSPDGQTAISKDSIVQVDIESGEVTIHQGEETVTSAAPLELEAQATTTPKELSLSFLSSRGVNIYEAANEGQLLSDTDTLCFVRKSRRSPNDSVLVLNTPTETFRMKTTEFNQSLEDSNVYTFRINDENKLEFDFNETPPQVKLNGEDIKMETRQLDHVDIGTRIVDESLFGTNTTQTQTPTPRPRPRPRTEATTQSTSTQSRAGICEFIDINNNPTIQINGKRYDINSSNLSYDDRTQELSIRSRSGDEFKHKVTSLDPKIRDFISADVGTSHDVLDQISREIGFHTDENRLTENSNSAQFRNSERAGHVFEWNDESGAVRKIILDHMTVKKEQIQGGERGWVIRGESQFDYSSDVIKTAINVSDNQFHTITQAPGGSSHRSEIKDIKRHISEFEGTTFVREEPNHYEQLDLGASSNA